MSSNHAESLRRWLGPGGLSPLLSPTRAMPAADASGWIMGNPMTGSVGVVGDTATAVRTSVLLSRCTELGNDLF